MALAETDFRAPRFERGWADSGHLSRLRGFAGGPLKAFAGDPRVLTLRPNTWLDHAVPARSLAAPAL